MSRWPSDNINSLISFYGNPGNGEVGRQLVRVVSPWTMYYEGKIVKSIPFHRKAAPALLAALNEIWEKVGKSQDEIDRLGLSKYGGTYNPRRIRGSSRWSNHAFGAAIDLDPDENGFNTGHGTMPQVAIDAFKRQGARWGGDYHGRTDPMHFEFCCDGSQVAEVISNALVPEAMADEVIDSHVGGEVGGEDQIAPNAPIQSGIIPMNNFPNQALLQSAKTIFKSKISWVLTLLGVTNATDLVNNDQVWQIITQLSHSPRVLITLALVAVGIYFYWHDHGKGSIK